MGKTFCFQKLAVIQIIVSSSLKKILPLLLAMYLLSCNAQPCSQLPQSFESYSQAISLIQKSSFSVKESANTSGSSWISSAKYYSCDGATGYLIIKTDNGGEYIHNGVSIDVWQDFKKGPSKGTFYNAHLKNRFRLIIN